MPLQKRLHLVQISRFGAFFREGDVKIVVDQYHQTGLRSKFKDAIECRIFKTGHCTRYLCGHKLLVDCKLADAREHIRKSLQNGTDVMCGVDVGWVEFRYYGV